MQTPKVVVEGVFHIPYQGQLRFSVKVENDELVFADGDKKFHGYFGYHESTSQYSDKPERHKHFDTILSSIKRFIAGRSQRIEIPVSFTAEVFGKKVEADGLCMLYRLYS